MQCNGLTVVICLRLVYVQKCPIFTTSSDIHGRWLGETGQRLNIIHDLDRDLLYCSEVWDWVITRMDDDIPRLWQSALLL
jgi:hypothetical protein